MDALLSPPVSLPSWTQAAPISFSKSRVPMQNLRKSNGYSSLDSDDDEVSIEDLVFSTKKESPSSSYHQNMRCSGDSNDSVDTIVFEHHVNAIAGCQEFGQEDESPLIQLVVSELTDVPSRPFETRRSSTRSSRRSSSISTSRRSSHRSSSLSESTHHGSASSLHSETGSLSSSTRNGSRRRKSGSRMSIRRDPLNDRASSPSKRPGRRSSSSSRRSSATSIDAGAPLSSGSTQSHSRRSLRRSSIRIGRTLSADDLPERPSSTHSRVRSSSRNRRRSDRRKQDSKQKHPSSAPPRGSRKYKDGEKCGSRPSPEEEVDETMPFRDRMIAILGIDESFLNSDDEGVL